MPTPADELRRRETLWLHGAQVVIDDARAILDAARQGRLDLLTDAVFPAPVRAVRLRLDRRVEDGIAVLRLRAEVHTAGLPASNVIINAAVLAAAGPVGVLLARQLASNNATATRLVDQTTADPAVSLPATITYSGPPGRADRLVGRARYAPRAIAVRATVPVDELRPEHLREMVRLVFRVVAEAVGGSEPLRGRSYRVTTHPEPPPVPSPRRARTDDSAATLDQIGGMREVVDQFREIAISFQHPDVMARWGAQRPQGILLYGPPGTGKTMLARALAHEIGGALREIRTPEILDKWLGGSERNIKQIFQEARRLREPTVMLFDEFDSIISYAGRGGDAASQAINAVAGIFKQEMSGLIEANPNVIVVATTNFPNRVDGSLIRSGRFDIKLSIPAPDEPARAEIFTKKIQDLMDRYESEGFQMFADGIDVTALAAASVGMTGADIQEVLRRVQLAKAMQDARGRGARPITQADLAAAVADLKR